MVLIGRYDHKVDGKNRIIIPIDFINQLKDKTVIVSRVSVFNKDILAVFPNAKVFDDKISSYMRMTIDNNDDFFQRYVSNFSSSVTIDGANKINLRKMIMIPDDRILTVVGKRDLFEIWNKNDYEEYLKSNIYRLKK